MKIELTKNRFIGKNFEPYIMAEIGINHNGDFDLAKKMILECKLAGADAVKFQKRTLTEMYTAEYLRTPYVKESSFGDTYGSHKEFLEFTDEQLIELQTEAKQVGITFIVSGFDFSGFDFIDKVLDVPFHKVASPLVTHIPLLKHVAGFKKPMVISTGMHTMEEVRYMYNQIKGINSNIVLLQCTTSYPTEDVDVNLSVLARYIDEFGVLAGYSSHDRGVAIPAASVLLGSCFIEKHFTMDRTAKGPDHISSVEPRGLELIVKYSKSIHKAIGSNSKELCDAEKSNRIKHGYSCVASRNLPKDTVIDETMVEYKQPGGGILPKDFDVFFGRKLKNALTKDQFFSYDDI
jgi:sialic acid synthase SpsE